MTEDSDQNRGGDSSITDGLNWGRIIWQAMTLAQVNGWFWWRPTCIENPITGGALYEANSGCLTIFDPDGTINSSAKRAWVFANYARFIRPGWVRIGATNRPTGGVFVSAYKDPSRGNFAIVAINQNGSDVRLKFSLKSFATGSVTPWITSASFNLAPQSPLSAGSRFWATLAAQSVTTFVGTRGSPSPPPTPR